MQGNAKHGGKHSAATVRGPGAAPLAMALIVLSVLVTGCGGNSPTGGVASLGSRPSSSHASTGSAASSEGHEASPGSQAVAYAACMREHGVANFPEPQVSEHGNEGSVKMAVPVGVGGNPKFKPAQQACRKLLPGGGPGHQAALTPAQQEQYLRAAACIRSHGVPSFPDPTFSAGGAHIPPGAVDLSSATVKTAVHDCESLIPGGVHGGGSNNTREAAPGQ
jgi:hypothetical protein